MHNHHSQSIKSLKSILTITFLVTKINKKTQLMFITSNYHIWQPIAPHWKLLWKLCKEFCKENFNIRLVFNSFKIKSYFLYKDSIPDDLKSFLVYKCSCTSCSSSCIGKSCCRFTTRIENMSKRITSLIFLNTYTPPQHVVTLIILYFKIDNANSKFDLKIKEALDINWTKPN